LESESRALERESSVVNDLAQQQAFSKVLSGLAETWIGATMAALLDTTNRTAKCSAKGQR
jgi:hypothetical protein